MRHHRLVAASVAALLAGAAAAEPMPDMRAHDHHHDAADPHLRLTAERTPSDADRARYAALEDTLRRELARYGDVAVAVADGYEPFLPGLPQRVVHYTRKSHGFAAVFGFDPLKPTSLLYRREPGGGHTLTGVMYTAPWWADEAELDARVPLAIAPWHQHVNWCVPGRRQRERWTETRDGLPLFGPKSPIATEAECEAVGGKFVERLFGWMVHVEAFAGG
jgi:hypothetical protein